MQTAEAICVSGRRGVECVTDGGGYGSRVASHRPAPARPVIWMPALARAGLPFVTARRCAQALGEWRREAARIRVEGIQLKREADGRPVFNFNQRIWLFPDVGMEWMSRPLQQAQNLAANILTPFLPLRGRYAYLCPDCLMGKEALEHGLAWQFARQILVPLSPEGVRIGPQFLDEWVLIHLKILDESQRGRTRGAKARTLRLPRGPWLAPVEDLD
jgi:hypothetical protein